MNPEQRLRRAIEAAVARLRNEVGLSVGCNQCLGLNPEAVAQIAADLEHAARNNEGG